MRRERPASPKFIVFDTFDKLHCSKCRRRELNMMLRRDHSIITAVFLVNVSDSTFRSFPCL